MVDIPEGYMLVPIKPTKTMLDAGEEASWEPGADRSYVGPCTVEHMWSKMLDEWSSECDAELSRALLAVLTKTRLADKRDSLHIVPPPSDDPGREWEVRDGGGLVLAHCESEPSAHYTLGILKRG